MDFIQRGVSFYVLEGSHAAHEGEVSLRSRGSTTARESVITGLQDYRIKGLKMIAGMRGEIAAERREGQKKKAARSVLRAAVG